MIKGFYQDKDTNLGSIVKLIWAHNPKMIYLHDTRVDCRKSLDHDGGRCDCRSNTFLRGQLFSREH
jgi:hypothetical protein